jgi:hypothetical protein
MPEPISVATQPVTPIPSTYALLPGEFYIQSWNGHLLSAAAGGGQTVDAIQTAVLFSDGTPLDSTEKFKLWHDTGVHLPTPISRFAIQTANGNYLTAVDGGGRTTDVLHTDATQIHSWEEFGIVATNGSEVAGLAIKTVHGNFLTAVGMGGKTTDAMHSDALKPGDWETFFFRKSGDLGTGYPYFITPEVGGLPLTATNGGGQTATAITVGGSNAANPQWGIFTLVQQPDGSYALQTFDGHYVTAVNGGGLAYGTPDSDNLQTNRTVVQAWEQFKILDQGDGYYCIQTVSGFYLGARNSSGPGQGAFSTDISDINQASKFTLALAGI